MPRVVFERTIGGMRGVPPHMATKVSALRTVQFGCKCESDPTSSSFRPLPCNNPLSRTEQRLRPGSKLGNMMR